jgi:catechol 2,3-dioxygenase-like lactoylglutathione lyase family enzyme
MALWNAKLTDILLTSSDPRGASAYWAELLGGEADAEGVALGGETRITVVEGAQEGLAEMGFLAGGELYDAAVAHGAAADGGTLTDPDGWTVRLERVEEVTPLVLEGATLSHCTLSSPDPNRQQAFYRELGFLLSDALGDIFCWMRPNPVHHSIAFAAREDVAINHLAVELPDRASFIGAIDRVVAAGGALEFGPGRHLVGGNLFAYLRDRYGLRWELCTELHRLDADAEPQVREAGVRRRSINLFGVQPPQSFLHDAGGPGPLAAR